VYKSDGVTVIKQWTDLYSPIAVAIGDYDNDGLNDIAIVENAYGRNMVIVYKSDGVTVIRQWTGLSNPGGPAIGDYDNDGLNDLAFPEFYAGQVTVYSSDGTIIKQFNGLNAPNGVAIGDYNNDGLNGFAFVETYGGKVTVYYQTRPVGGIWIPVDKLSLLAPYIGLVSTILVATVATAIYVKRRKKKQ